MLKITILLPFLLLASCAATRPASELNASERRVIDGILDRWYEAWESGDAALAASGYSDDADFTNAFGHRCRGRAEIEALLDRVFSLEFVMAGRSEEVEREVRLAAPDVALVRSTVRRVGQQMNDGAELDPRRTSHLRVVRRGPEGWEIVSHLISDARSTSTREH